MRLAVLSDIHANVWALEAVLEDAAVRGVDGYVDLGDLLHGPLAPRETFELLQPLGAVTVRGNQDRTLVEAGEQDLRRDPTLAFVASEVGAAGVGWLRTLPETAELEGMLLCHGTPASDTEYLLEEVSSGFPRIRPPAEILRDLADHRQSLVLCGHTHVPRAVHLPGGQIVLNPGSIGLPAYDHDAPVLHFMESHSPFASYAVVERRGGSWTLEHRRVPYPFETAARRAGELGRPDWQSWLLTGFSRR